MRAKVFVSCGQASREEKEFAQKMENWLDNKGFKCFVSSQVNNLPNLNKNVIDGLRSSDYFLFVNFAREEISSSSGSFKRGSLYTNQELAIAISLGFDGEEIMLLFNESDAKREGILSFMAVNAEFGSHDQAMQIITESISKRWKADFSGNLVVSDPINAGEASDFKGKDLFITHVDVSNKRELITARDCRVRLLKVSSPNTGEIESPNQAPLKVTGQSSVFQSPVGPCRTVRFDLYAIGAADYPNLYLLSNSDLEWKPILTAPDRYTLTYEISADGFPNTTKEIEVDLTGPPPRYDPGRQHSPSGYSTIATVSTDPAEAIRRSSL